MLIRIVKLEFKTDHIADFKGVFERNKQRIRSSEGCQHLELWQDQHQPHIFFTCSHWESEEFLNAYRHSDFFQGAWKEVKLWFAARPVAWSVEKIGEAE